MWRTDWGEKVSARLAVLRASCIGWETMTSNLLRTSEKFHKLNLPSWTESDSSSLLTILDTLL